MRCDQLQVLCKYPRTLLLANGSVRMRASHRANLQRVTSVVAMWILHVIRVGSLSRDVCARDSCPSTRLLIAPLMRSDALVARCARDDSSSVMLLPCVTQCRLDKWIPLIVTRPLDCAYIHTYQMQVKEGDPVLTAHTRLRSSRSCRVAGRGGEHSPL